MSGKKKTASNHEAKVLVINQQSQSPQKSKQIVDPLAEELMSMKITENIVKEISFNSAVNRFQYLEEALQKQSKQFKSTVDELEKKQRQLVQGVKTLSKEAKQIETPEIDFSVLATQTNTLLELDSESDKFLKLSMGMLNAVKKLQASLNEALDKK